MSKLIFDLHATLLCGIATHGRNNYFNLEKYNVLPFRPVCAQLCQFKQFINTRDVGLLGGGKTNRF